MSKLKLKEIKPLNNQIITTADTYREAELSEAGIYIDIRKIEHAYKFHQTVLAVGPNVRQLKVGDIIMIDPTRYVVPEHPEDEDSIRGIVKVRNTHTKISFPILEIGGVERMLLNDSDAAFVILDYKEE